MTTVEVVTDDFEENYGRTPRGRGAWAFAFYADCSQPIKANWFAKDAAGCMSMTYGEAKRIAIKEARRIGATYACLQI